MADSYGNTQNCCPLLAAYLAGYPEQVLVNIVPTMLLQSQWQPMTTLEHQSDTLTAHVQWL